MLDLASPITASTATAVVLVVSLLLSGGCATKRGALVGMGIGGAFVTGGVVLGGGSNNNDTGPPVFEVVTLIGAVTLVVSFASLVARWAATGHRSIPRDHSKHRLD